MKSRLDLQAIDEFMRPIMQKHGIPELKQNSETPTRE
jgi:hypothetical protein